MSRLNDAQRQAIEERLLLRRDELEARVRQATEEHAQRPSAISRQVEDAAEEGEERFRNGIEHVEMQRDKEELTDIAATIERMAQGRYGECQDCGKDIAPERLAAQPTASRCIVCQGLYEKKHGNALRYLS